MIAYCCDNPDTGNQTFADCYPTMISCGALGDRHKTIRQSIKREVTMVDSGNPPVCKTAWSHALVVSACLWLET